jgi:hypothetical protein
MGCSRYLINVKQRSDSEERSSCLEFHGATFCDASLTRGVDQDPVSVDR